MQITYTANELYKHICSFNTIEFWGNQNSYNVSMILTRTSNVFIRNGRKYSYISVEKRLCDGPNVFICCFNITGNMFSCKVERGNTEEHLIITSDCVEAPVRIVLKNYEI